MISRSGKRGGREEREREEREERKDAYMWAHYHKLSMSAEPPFEITTWPHVKGFMIRWSRRPDFKVGYPKSDSEIVE